MYANMSVVDITNCPVIFPKLMIEMIRKGMIFINGKRRSDAKLLALLCARVEVPHIMYLKQDEWIAVDSSEIYLKMFKDDLPYSYDNLRSSSIGEVISFLRVCGSVSFEIGQIDVHGSSKYPVVASYPGYRHR